MVGDQVSTAWGKDSTWGGEVGGDTRSLGFDQQTDERLTRRVPHPAVPDLERVRTFKRSLARLGRARREHAPQYITDAHPQEGDPLDFDLCVIRFVTTTCLQGDTVPTLDANANLERLVDGIDPEELPYWKAAILAEARDGSARSVARHLADRPKVADALGFDPSPPASHSTYSRHWDYTPEMQAAIEELGIRARYGALWLGAEFPPHLQEDGWGVEAILDSEPTQDEKMVAIQHIVEEGIAVVAPHIAFDRDPESPAYKLSPAAMIVYIAHLALENSYVASGSRTLKWLDLPAPVPAADTVFRYIRELSTVEIDEKFAYATAALLTQEIERSPDDPGTEALEPPIHLAYDMTDIRWWGSKSTEWTNWTFEEKIPHKRGSSPSCRLLGGICSTSSVLSP